MEYNFGLSCVDLHGVRSVLSEPCLLYSMCHARDVSHTLVVMINIVGGFFIPNALKHKIS
jgi:hypothetical protein